MRVLETIPTLDTNRLTALEENAHRWADSGTEKQKADAATVLAAITAEWERRASPNYDLSSAAVGSSAFEDVWGKLVATLRPDDSILNWSVNGHTGGTFKVVTVGNSWVGVFGASMTEARNVSKGDFAKVYAVWDDYVAGNYPRAKMTNLSQNTTYILSILRRVVGG